MDEAGQFVTGVKVLFEWCVTRNVEVIGVTENGPTKPLGITELRKNGLAILRMLIQRRVAFPIEVVQQPNTSPHVRVLSQRRSVGPK